MSNQFISGTVRAVRAAKAFTTDFINQLFDFGTIIGSSNGTSNSTQVTIRGLPNHDDSAYEEFENAEVWDHPAVLWKPEDPALGGTCECLFWRRGSELVCLAGKERKWQVTVGTGEVVVRGLAAGSGYIKLKTDGMIEIGKLATDFVALATLVVAQLNDIRTKHDTHTHTHPMGPTGTPIVPMGPAGSVAATKTKAE